MNMRALIIDDEPLARRGLRLRLQAAIASAPELDSIEVVGEAANGREGQTLIAAEMPDLIFLDIQMPGLDGFEMLASLPTHQWPQVIFTTAYDQYAIEAFKVHALAYLLKPVETEELIHVLKRAFRLHQTRDEVQEQSLARLLGGGRELGYEELAGERLSIKDGGTLLRIPMAEIQWIDAAGDYVIVHTAAENHIARASLRDLAERLPKSRFVRIHRSTIVNVSAVTKLRPHQNGEYFVSIAGGKELKLSRGFKDQVARFE
jgi:two-component system LytT family response regulator